jgi:hypothetical protein
LHIATEDEVTNAAKLANANEFIRYIQMLQLAVHVFVRFSSPETETS